MIRIKSILPPFLASAVFLIVCLFISCLYALDIFSSQMADASCLFAGCLLYMGMGAVFSRCIKKRQFIIALFLSGLLLFLQFLHHSLSRELIQDSVKLLLFLGSVLFYKLKSHL